MSDTVFIRVINHILLHHSTCIYGSIDYSEAEHSLFVIHKKYGNPNGVFAEEVGKLFILVKLLIGEKPDLNQVPSTRPLRPYRDLAVVVMQGDLSAYKHVIEQKKQQFVEDGLMRIVSR